MPAETRKRPIEGPCNPGCPVLFAGDTLFKGSIGRTDLWGGSLPAITHSIRDRLLTLPETTLVIPGHGPETTVAAEREDNPYVGRFAR